MKEYDELVKSLRLYGFLYDSKLAEQAADAIEELGRQNKNWEEAMKVALDFIPKRKNAHHNPSRGD